MFTQFFGNYLLNEGLLTTKQLISAMDDVAHTRMKLGVLAINSGYMTSSQVERIHEIQSKMDKKIGDIAVDLGYLTKEQVDELLSIQPNGYLVLGQAIVDKGYMTNTAFEQALSEYKSKCSLSVDENSASESNYEPLLKSVYDFSQTSEPGLYKEYVTLLINNLIRFIGDDFTLLDPETNINSTSFKSIKQNISGDYSFTTRFFADESALIKFCERYFGENLFEINEYVESSAQDFLNLNNGLFTVNVSNSNKGELKLTPPSLLHTLMPSMMENTIILPFQFTFGTVRFSITII